MKTRTSIAFEALTGTAGNVTARSTRFGTVLSGRRVLGQKAQLTGPLVKRLGYVTL